MMGVRAWARAWAWAWAWVWVGVGVGCVGHALAMPVPQEGVGGGQERAWLGRDYLLAGLGVASLLTTVTALLACVCCKRSRGFKELGSVSSRVAGSSSTLTPGPREEITLFPPAGLSLSTTQINFEPLPDIRPRPAALGPHPRPPADRTLPPFFPSRSPASPAAATPADEWFAEPHQNFPRNQLQYVRELGRGWFGQVLEGQAAGVYSDHTKGESPVGTTVGWDGSGSTRKISSSSSLTPVAVKVLREDATPQEQQYFLQELRPFRDLSHPNVLRVLAHCLEAEPFLILLQLCPKGDLKGVLMAEGNLSEVTLLRMTLDVAAGLSHMHTHNFIHTDLAARNCVVEEDNTVKIGDYGFSLDSYKEEYYCAGEVALPLRWCSPETLRCTDTTIETKEVTQAANVWSFGVVMWEVASRGELPYAHLDHEQVIQEVIVDQTCQLDLPPNLHLHAEKLYNIMKQCWEGAESRPSMPHTHSLLTHLWEHAAGTSDQDTASLGDFEQRWNQLQQQQDCRDHSIMHTGNASNLRFESDFNLLGVDRHSLGETLSPSLQNLHGSAEDLDARVAAKFKSALPSWLGVEPGQPIDSLTQEITDAILKLDDYLAGEKSEPSTGEASPEKGGVNFKLGKDSFVSNPPESIVARMGTLGEGSGHPSISGTLSEEEEEGFTMRLEQGEFTEMVRLKSQSVQDFMKLTVVDDTSDSDTASQRNSIGFEPLTQEKTFSSEGNIKEALRDVKFMGELERLQAEHRYSIITEASRECASSIEYRNQSLNGEALLRDEQKEEEEEEEDTQRGSTDRLIADVESEGSSHSHEMKHSEQDPFLGEVISSGATEEIVHKTCDSEGGRDEATDELDSCVEAKPLPASPDCVVSSREPKPATLPDIVAHNGGSSLAHSTPSPPPSPSTLTHIKNSQPKEFRFVFGDESMEGLERTVKGLPGVPAQAASVVFSDNITGEEEKAQEGKGENSSQGKVVVGVSNIEDTSVLAAEQDLKNNCVGDTFSHRNASPVLGLHQKHSSERLASTPCKAEHATVEGRDRKEDDLKHSERVSSEFSDTGASFTNNNEESVCANNSRYEEAKPRLVFGTSCGEDKRTSDEGEREEDIHDKEAKQRLVFGTSCEEDSRTSNKGKCEEDMHDKEAKQRLVFGMSYGEDKSTDEKGDNKEDFLPGLGDSLPSYTPEKIVTGEEVVIGASEDYSLDLYRAIKSTEGPPSSPGAGVLSTEGAKCGVTKKSCTEISSIEFDLEQWDKFLGKTLSRENSCSDPVFMEGLLGEDDMEGGVVNEALAMDFSLLENHIDSKVGDISDISDFDSSVFYSAREEADGTPTLPEVESKPVSVSGSSHKGNRGTALETLHRPSGVLNHPSSSSAYSEEESYITAASKVTTSPADASLEKATTHSNSNTPSTPTRALKEGVMMDESLSLSPNTNWGDLDTSGHFTYRKEAPVDTSFEQPSRGEPLNTNFKPELMEGTLSEPAPRKPPGDADLSPQDTVDSAVYSCNSVSSSYNENFKIGKCSENLLLNLHDEDSTSKTLSVSEPSEPVDEASSLNLRCISSALDFRPPDSSAAHTTLIIKGEDDLSPSAYQGSWTAQDAAPGNDDAENGDFWEQQMVAWQAAAFQTRQLLQEAAGEGVEGGVGEQTSTQEEQEEVSPRSNASSSPKSHYSSSDLLNLDDEGTYVSYNTTDEEEVLGYRPEDINALRAELSLKLETGQGEAQEEEEPREPEDSTLEDRDNVVINYRGIMASTLSPIKEESFLEEDDTPSRRGSQGGGAAGEGDPAHDCSIEFEEPASSECDGNKGDTFVIVDANSSDLPVPVSPQSLPHATDSHTLEEGSGVTQDALGVTLENAHDSLILEDLDEEDGPASIQIYNSGMDLEAEDILVINTETNEATILDQGRPRSHLAFVVEQEQPPEASPLHPFGFEDTDDVAPESIPSEEGRSLLQKLQKPSSGSAESWEPQEYEGSGSKSKSPATEFVITNNDVASDSPAGIQVPAYHSYFTSALSSINHPSASLEEPPLFEQVEQISLPYDVNYPPPAALEEEEEEELHSLEDVQQQEREDGSSGGHNISEIEDDEDTAPIKLSFLGRLYSDDSEEKEEQHRQHGAEREATLLSDSEGEDSPGKKATSRKSHEPTSISQMTSAEFLASEKYQTDDGEEVEEHITAEADSEDDSEEENSPGQSPHKGGGPSAASQEPRYTPDWESDSDSDGDSSSTSGEFMWRPGEPCQPSPYILDIIEEEPDEDGEREEGEFSEDSESGEEEFTPSQWNSDLTPSHSLLKSPQNKSSLKKRVRWKRQRHHRVYEYPPEPRSWEQHAFTEPQYRRSWGRSSIDYLNLADWELGADEFIADQGEDMEDYVYHKPSRPAPPPPIYSLGPMTYDEAAEGFLVDNGEFFIRSSGSPFTFTRSSFSASDFFPGGGHSSDYDVIFGGSAQTPGVGVPYPPPSKVPESQEESEEQITYPSEHERHSEEELQAANSSQEDSDQQQVGGGGSLGQLRHTRDKLRLEIPSMSLSGDSSSKGSVAAGSGLENGGGLDFSDQNNFVIMNHSNRVEPEVSEV